MKEIVAIIQITLLALRFANWIARKVDQRTWEDSGYAKAVADQIKNLNLTVGIARAVKEEIEKKTETEVLSELEKNKELRD